MGRRHSFSAGCGLCGLQKSALHVHRGADDHRRQRFGGSFKSLYFAHDRCCKQYHDVDLRCVCAAGLFCRAFHDDACGNCVVVRGNAWRFRADPRGTVLRDRRGYYAAFHKQHKQPLAERDYGRLESAGTRPGLSVPVAVAREEDGARYS